LKNIIPMFGSVPRGVEGLTSRMVTLHGTHV
jgi:hypothetical protein